MQELDFKHYMFNLKIKLGGIFLTWRTPHAIPNERPGIFTVRVVCLEDIGKIDLAELGQQVLADFKKLDESILNYWVHPISGKLFSRYERWAGGVPECPCPAGQGVYLVPDYRWDELVKEVRLIGQTSSEESSSDSATKLEPYNYEDWRT